ncbi:MAG TPA: cation:proton antiporter [Pirellulales bacterium]|jgi:CPA2 family monovalent cation:H+ antiporter-2|nr:cation:proton antiporter [Pirellulales bacterium]
MREIDLLLTLTGALTAAVALGYLTQRLGLSPIVGYLLAGLVVGPNTPGFIANQHLADQLAEIGVILLMFGVGLHFKFDQLARVWRVAAIGAVGQSAVATLLGCALALAFGWNGSAGLVFGLAISVASTVVLLRVLEDNRQLHSPAGQIAVTWLIVEDLFTALVLVAMPAFFAPQPAGLGVGWGLGWSLLKVALLILFVVVAGGRVIPWLLRRMAATQSRELFTLTVLVLALGIAAGAARAFDVSIAFGAFLAGLVVGRSEFSARAAADALPMRDAFAVLFFVSIGMLLEPGSLLKTPGLIAATLAIILLGKPLAALAITALLGQPWRVGLAIAVALAQIGEFSFILAEFARELGVLSAGALNALIAAAIISISVNPLLYRSVNMLAGEQPTPCAG